ncbi:iron complex outermembrane receptor protein [Dysgonomonas sp. PH5-45]|uniref:TonB-dependent receptor n=1 Tax=unclassified Dysgonomonas TaxID=2630389 RepID=UPI0024766668|nr:MULTISPECIES: TonB-dependent receptor [unclassified Dysgonomonas]MDH6355219.1 iron complex outermembrane receptor protein [Dysgonomonas sp. PH5-45]MDH6388158.1 iron complex outermembrane receptor protein [Dysgonomonas sp. PH5-37]
MKKEILFIIGALFSASSLCAVEVPDSIKQVKLEGVTVSAQRAGGNAPIAYSNLNQTQIKQDNAAKNIPFILQTLPSVVAFSEDGSGVGNTSLRIRGVDATRINVTLNGMPLNNPESQEVYWVNFPDVSNSLQSIQVQRGVGTSTNGTASIGGSISLNTTAANSKPYGEATGSLGSYGTSLYSLAAGTGILKNGLSLDARFSKVNGDGYIRNGKVDHRNLYVALSYYGEKELFRLSYMKGVQHTGITWEGISPEQMAKDRRYNSAGEYTDDDGNTRYYDNETDNYYSDIAQLSYSRFLSASLTFNASFNYMHGYGYYENYKADQSLGSKFGLDNQIVDGVEYEISDVIRRKLMDNDLYTANMALEYKADKLKITGGGFVSAFHGNHYGRLPWVKYNENIPKNYEWYRNNSEKKEFSLFAKAEYNVIENLNLFGDVQYRYVDYRMFGMDDDFANINNRNNYSFFNPKLGVSYALGENAKYGNVYAFAAISNREPLRTDIKESIKGGGTQKIKSERLFDYELGYTKQSAMYSFGANAYYMYYKDQMVQTGKLNDVGYKLMENVPDSYRIGIELSGAVKPTNWVRVDANVSFSQNKIKNYTAYYDLYDTDWNSKGQVSEFHKKTDISFSPNVVGSGIISFFPVKNATLSLVGKYVGKQYYDNTSDEELRLNDYFVGNVVAGYTFKLEGVGSADLQIFVNNVLNKRYVANAWTETYKFTDGTKEVYTGLFPQATRNFMAKLTLRF